MSGQDHGGITWQRNRPLLLSRFSAASVKLHLAAIRHFFDLLVTRHVVILNPAATVRGPRYQTIEGKTPEITIKQARRLLASIDVSHAVGLRDRAILGTLAYTAARVGAIAKLKRRHYIDTGEQRVIRFEEKGGKSREIPVRHDLVQWLDAYLEVAGGAGQGGEAPLFRSAAGKTHRLTDKPMTAGDICRMVKRRLKAAGLPSRLSPHSFRVTAATDLLNQDVPLADVQYLLGHADPRTTRIYDRRPKRVTRNLVERISI